MNRTASRALAAARPVIQGLTLLNLLYGLSLIALLCFSVFMNGWPERALGFDLLAKYPQAPWGLRAIVIVGIAGAAIVHTVLRRLLAIVDSVRGGDPFVLDNVRRLNLIAWSVVALEVLRVIVALIAAAVWEPGRVDGFSFTPWLAVLLLFVLSGVFAHGARMRADLEGTV